MAKSRSYGGLIVTLVIIGASAAGGWYFWSRSADKTPEIATITIGRGDIFQVVTATGGLQPFTSVDVSSQVSGLITEVDVDYNTVVKIGQVLCKLDPATYQSKLAQAEAQLANTKANYILTRLNTERTRELRQKNLVSQQDLDTAEAQLSQAEAQMKIQQANVNSATVDLSRCTIYSPLNGIVIDRLAEKGKTVAASLNAPTIFTIVDDLAKMQIDAAVAEADIGGVEVGQQVNFTVDAFPSRQFRGVVSLIRNSPKTVSNVVTYDTIIDVNNDDLRLKPGMTANVSIVIAQRTNAMKIGNSALRVRIPEEVLQTRLVEIDFSHFGADRGNRSDRNGGGGGNAVVSRNLYRLIGSDPKTAKFESVRVQLGITDGISTEVIGGVKEGDAIVTAVTLPNAAASTSGAPGQPSNPFAGQQRGGPGGMRGH